MMRDQLLFAVLYERKEPGEASQWTEQPEPRSLETDRRSRTRWLWKGPENTQGSSISVRPFLYNRCAFYAR